MIFCKDLGTALAVCTALLAVALPGVSSQPVLCNNVIIQPEQGQSFVEVNGVVDNTAGDCTLINARVNGDVSSTNGGTLRILNTAINGDVQTVNTPIVIIEDSSFTADFQADGFETIMASGFVSMNDFQVADGTSASLKCASDPISGATSRIGGVEASNLAGSFTITGCEIIAPVQVVMIGMQATISNNLMINGAIIAEQVKQLVIQNNVRINGGINCQGLENPPIIDQDPGSLNGVCELECAAACVPDGQVADPSQCNDGAVLDRNSIPGGTPVVFSSVTHSSGVCTIRDIEIQGNVISSGEELIIEGATVLGSVEGDFLSGRIQISSTAIAGSVTCAPRLAGQVDQATRNNVGGSIGVECP